VGEIVGMWLDVICAPTELPFALIAKSSASCAVIDVVRATTSLLVLGERGLSRAFAVENVIVARALAEQHPGCLLAGEVNALPPEGFDLGNSPAQIARSAVAGREAILATTNGTRTLIATWQAGAASIFVAALRNASAIARQVITTRPNDTFYIVCAGRSGRVALDDLYTAGVIALRTKEHANATGFALELTEQAQIATSIAMTAEEPLHILSRSEAGRSVQAAGLAEDLPFCAMIDATDLVPVVTSGPDNALMITYPHG
jgi:2-phosphosulfolactate phosphatase